MPRNKEVEMDSKIQKKLDYIGLDMDYIPSQLTKITNINFRSIRGYDEKKYTQYRYVDVKDIEILLSPTTRVTSIKEKYEKAEPLCLYLDSENEENILRYTEFLRMLNKVSIKKIQEIEKEQEKLAKKIPFKVKFNGNYLWQVYYSEVSDKYFMIVPTRDSDYSTFFYLLKKKIEADEEESESVFIPISCVDYEGRILSKQEIKDIENYLWLFTKDYPLIYEVWDKKENVSLNILGEAEIYDKTKTLYKIVLKTSKEGAKFYKLLKALFILQTELPHFFKFNTNIDKNGNLSFYLDEFNITYSELPDFIQEQYSKSVELTNKLIEDLEDLQNKLSRLQRQSRELEKEFMDKEKQIAMFLECKKTFFGKVKYFFKLGKTSKKTTKNKKNEAEIEELRKRRVNNKNERAKVKENKNYTLYELEQSYKELEAKQEEANNIVMDINALKLKNKNLIKKIDNATNYIEEINKHKKSIFEFWKYSNKDAVSSLEEGEEEELNVVKLEKVFNFDDEFENFGNEADKLQRNKLTDSELESVYIANTNILELLNRIYLKTAENREIAILLKKIKKVIENTQEEEESEFDIFGRLKQASNEEGTIANKVHREQPRDEVSILEVNRDTKGVEFKKRLITILKHIRKALKKISLNEEMYVYKATSEKLEFNTIEKVSLECDKELEKFLKNNKNNSEVYLYKLKLPKGANYVAFSNIIFFDNKNMTLPVGMNLSSDILINLEDFKVSNNKEKKLNKLEFENDEDDFSNIQIKEIEVNELTLEKKEKKSHAR